MNVLFVCTGNSARSIIAEAVFNSRARGRCEAFSAGSRPTGEVHPLAIETLNAAGYATSGLTSKSWDELSGDRAVPFDFVITLCDSAAREACPVWAGAPVTRHWGLADPAAIEGIDDRRRAFAEILLGIERQVEIFLKDEFK